MLPQVARVSFDRENKQKFLHFAEMSESQNPDRPHNHPSTPPSISIKLSNETNYGYTNTNTSSFSGQKVNYPSPPNPTNSDPATLRE